MRGMLGMIYETSKLHPINGITYRGKDLYEIRDESPKAPGGNEPLPEAVLWLLLTGEFPNESELKDFQHELFRRGQLTEDQEKLIKSLPSDMHPMTQFSIGVLACQPGSKFAKAYKDGVHKSKYWDSTLEDALDLCAKVSRIAALVFNNSYFNVSNM
jgi:citrate synthase